MKDPITSRSSRCRAPAFGWLVLWAAVLASISNAQASDITYYIADYPANELDPTSGTDTVSGTVITNGTTGSLSATDLIGGTFSLSGPQFDISGSASFGQPIGLVATATQLLLDPSASSSFTISTAIYTPPPPGSLGGSSMEASVTYENNLSGGQYFGGAGGSFGTLAWEYPTFDTSPVPTTPGSISANTDWVIATVPEPSTFVLLGVGAVSLAAYAARTASRFQRRSRCGFVGTLVH